MKIQTRESVNYSNDEFFGIVIPLIEEKIEQFKKSNNCGGCIQMWLGYKQGLNTHRVLQDQIEALSAELNEAGWINHSAHMQTDERTGENQIYIVLYL